MNCTIPMALLCLFLNPIFAKNNTSSAKVTDEVSPCTIDYRQTLQSGLEDLKTQLVDSEFFIQKKENNIYCKSDLNYPAKAYLGDELHLKVEDVVYYQTQILLKYNENFYVVLDNFSDFEMTQIDCEKTVDESLLASILPAPTLQQEEAEIESIVTIKYIDSEELINEENATLNLSEMTKRMDQSTAFDVKESLVILPAPEKSMPITSSPTNSIASPTEPIIEEYVTTKNDSQPMIMQQISTTPPAAKPFWLQKNRPKNSTEKLVVLEKENPLEKLWNNPVNGNFFSGCANGKCSFNPYASFAR